MSRVGYRKHVKNLDKPYKYASLLADIEKILQENKYHSTYGAKRMYEKLQLDYDCPYSYTTVAKVMRLHGYLHSANKPKGLTVVDKKAQKAEDLVHRDFTATKPCEKTVTDMTEFKASDGKLYVSALFDCFDSVCLGLSIDTNMRTELALETYFNAMATYDLRKAITHSDRGGQYTSQKFKAMLKENGIIQSMNSAGGRCHDNAKCESMWARAKDEIGALYNVKTIPCAQLKCIIEDYFLCYWNEQRICSAIGGMPPMVKRGAYFEKMMDAA